MSRRPSVFVCLLLLGMPAALPADLGNLLSKAASIVAKQDDERSEIAVGRAVAGRLLGRFDLVADPRLQQYVNRVGHWVALQSERPGLPWRFGVVESPALNAFATPGGIVLLTRGLYQVLESEDELAAVLAHEIAHVVRKHHYAVVRNQELTQLIAGELQQRAGSSDALLQTVAGRATEVLARGLDQSAEYQADRDGMVLAARAGYDSSALLAVLERIERAGDGGADTALLLSTHPSPGDRLRALGAVVTPALEAAAQPSPAAGRLLRRPLPRDAR
jgi:predicted Zn-dependent protease